MNLQIELKMNKKLKIIIYFSLIVIVVCGLFFTTRVLNYDINILDDLSDIRSSKSKEELELNKYYEYLKIIDSLKVQKSYEDALRILDTLTYEGIFKDNLLLEKSKIYFDLGQFEKAKNGFSEIYRKSESRNIKALVWRSYTYIELKKCDSALTDIENAYNLNPTFEKDYNRIKEHCGSLK